MTYLDMAATLSQPHPEHPYERDAASSSATTSSSSDEDWRRRACSRSSGSASSPASPTSSPATPPTTSSPRSTRSAIRDGANLVVEGYDFAPTFSIWTTIEECLNPPVIWEKDRGWYTTAPFSEPEVFDFPEGIGPVECVNVEHEEVLLVPRGSTAAGSRSSTGSATSSSRCCKTLHKLGLDSTDEGRRSAGVEVAPRDVVAATLPDPATLGDRMSGKTCAGTW